MRECFAAVLHIAVEAISVEASFFELGGNSLRAVALSRRLAHTFGCTFSVATLLRSPSVGQSTRQALATASLRSVFNLVGMQDFAAAFEREGYELRDLLDLDHDELSDILHDPILDLNADGVIRVSEWFSTQLEINSHLCSPPPLNYCHPRNFASLPHSIAFAHSISPS